MAKALTPIEAFLAPLTRLAVRHDCDGQVIWADGPDWRAQEDETDMLDPDEIAFYAEGMLIEGYCLHWQVLADDGSPVLARLFFWQDDAPAIPAPQPGLTLAAEARWPPQ